MSQPLLPGHVDRLPWRHEVGSIRSLEALRTRAGTDLTVVLGEASGKPPVGDVRTLWNRHTGSRDAPIVVAVAYSTDGNERYAIHGPTDETAPVFDVPRSTVETVLAWALGERSHRTLIREITLKLDSLETGDPRPRNEGLFTAHVLDLQPRRPEFAAHTAAGRKMLPRRGTDLLHDLGYAVADLTGTQASLLLSDSDTTAPRRALAVLLTTGESIDSPLGRLGSTTAVTYGRDLAIQEGLPWLVVLAGSRIRLCPTNPDVGVGRKGVTHTYVELDLDHLTPETAGYLPILFSSDSLAVDGAVPALLEESARHAVGLAGRLRERIHERIMPVLSQATADANGVPDLGPGDRKDGLAEAYHQAMIVLFRLLFIAYAEDRGLLPYSRNRAYADASLESVAAILIEDDHAFDDDRSTCLWGRITALWRVIDKGDHGLNVPPCHGGLFSDDPERNPSGAKAYALDLTDDVTSSILRALLIDSDDDGTLGPVDFRDLDVCEFGTIYEGLLGSGLSIAETDLTVDANDTYVPVRRKADEVWVAAGQVYFHSRAGTRKATGSYFTKPFAVHHLLDNALEPALTAHLDRVAALNDQGRSQAASDLLWDFRIADLAMGSAHFLVAAIDRVQDRFSRFLATHPLTPVTLELSGLREAAKKRAGETVSDADLDDAALLRRVIARRCIYGLDVSEIAVELARLAVWIHTFVPGLPLSFLDHNLVWGNSLTGIGTLAEITDGVREAEAREQAEPRGNRGTSADPRDTPESEAKSRHPGRVGSGLMLDLSLRELRARAHHTLASLVGAAETTPAEVDRSRAHQAQLLQDLAPLSALCDLIAAERTTRALGTTDPNKIRITALPDLLTATTGAELENAILSHPTLDRAQRIARSVRAAHMPVLFPEVFDRDDPGFDVVLGNPPWKELTVEELQFWSIRFPGLKGMASEAQRRRVQQLRGEFPDLLDEYERQVLEYGTARALLTNGPYDGIGEGDPDVYKAFAWRFWALTRDGGRVGVLVPRSMWVTRGGAQWRSQAMSRSTTVIDLCRNTHNWLFDGVNVGYQITMFTLVKNLGAGRVGLRGEFASLADFLSGKDAEPAWLDVAAIAASDPDVCIPSLTGSGAASLYTVLLSHPRLSDGRRPKHRPDFRVAPATEIHATNDGMRKGVFSGSSGDHPVHNHRNVGVFAFDPDVAAFNHAPFDETVEWLRQVRLRSAQRAASPFRVRRREWSTDASTLPALNPRLVFRDVIHSSNKRKVWFALAPGRTLLTNTAPYLVLDGDDTPRDAYLLGVLNSGPVDWYGHLRINLHLNFFILYGLPVPLFDPADPRQQRIAALAAYLAVHGQSGDFGDWPALAATAGTPVDRTTAVAEVDALATLVFGIEDELLPLVYDGNPTRPDLDAVLRARASWNLEAAEGPR